MRLLRLLRAVLWSFVGVRRGVDATRDLEGVRPRTIAAAAFVVVLLLVVGLASLVRWIVGNGFAPEPARETSEVSVTPDIVVAQPRGPVRVADTMQGRMRACTVCHGSATQATRDGFSPRIAGKPAGYLFNQLVSFRDGRRTYPPMVYLVQYMSDDYLREIAAYFAALELPYPAPEATTLSEAASARARSIIEDGDPSRALPACAECHGAKLAGMEPAIPGLRGLPRDYINAQLGGWRTGKLRSVEPDCMAEIARRLTPEDAVVLAAWLAAQPPTRHAEIQAAPSRALPLSCGSVDRTDARTTQARTFAAGLERGRYLVVAGDCIACHTAQGGPVFAGGRAIDTPFGTVYSSNITPDASTGIGRWSADDFWRALHSGRSRDGRLLYPAFPYPNFTQVTREDADAMYAYLQSLPSVSRTNTPHALRFPYGTQPALALWRLLFFREGGFIADGAKSAEWNRGAYLVRGLGHCDACHAPRNMFGAVSHNLDLAGGLIPMQNWYAPPLLSAEGAGVAGWGRGDIEALLKSGVSQRGMAMGPMAEVVYRSTQHLTDDDVRAISFYLHSFPANAKAVAPADDARDRVRGAAVYEDHCAECHGSNGEGAMPAYPALAGNPSVTEPLPANAVKAVLNGGYAPVTRANPRPYGMPPFLTTLADRDIAAVLTYVRTSWGNRAPAVTTLDVDRYR